MINSILRIRSLLLAFLLLTCFAGPAAAQSVDEITDRMAEEYNQWITNLDNVTTVATVEGSIVPIDSVITYQEITNENGTLQFETKSKMIGGMPNVVPGDESSAKLDLLSNYHKMFDLLREHATLAGTETIDGEETYVLKVEDMTAFYEAMMAPQWSNPNMEIDAKNGRIYIDSDQWVVRRIGLDLTVARGRAPHTIQAVTTLSDYRTVNGLLYPFRVETTMNHMLSEQQQQQMKQRIQQMQQQLEQMPEERRKQVEAMMGPQLERMQEMADGTMTLAFVVQDLRVNAGMPDVFEE